MEKEKKLPTIKEKRLAGLMYLLSFLDIEDLLGLFSLVKTDFLELHFKRSRRLAIYAIIAGIIIVLGILLGEPYLFYCVLGGIFFLLLYLVLIIRSSIRGFKGKF
jgi:hypothetical protein